jgi:subtilase family serine protease
MELVFNIRNPVQFKQCLSSLSDPASDNYGHFLNSTTLGPYAPTLGQRLSIVAFLKASGFTVSEGFSPLVLNVNATAAGAEKMFGIKIGLYRPGLRSSFYATDSDPSLPVNFAELTMGILGLDNYTTVKPAESPCSGPQI